MQVRLDLGQATALTISCGCSRIEQPQGSRWREITPSINALSPEASVFFSTSSPKPRVKAFPVPSHAFVWRNESRRGWFWSGLEEGRSIYPYSIIRRAQFQDRRDGETA
ncbi:hypothetical protein DL98DRAFT_570599 [Cadophora sp. DSE1049]|nr:hypothetical protein DL98DRAFT_570599 [Cadophora sp. DSE1049]